MCRQLVKNGWAIEDIENADFELLMQVIMKPNKGNNSKGKPMDLGDFIKSL